MTVINGDEFDELLEMARSLLGANEGASDLWDANDAVNRALRLRVGDSEAWLLKCQILSALEDDASALASAEMALRRAPRSAEAQYWRAAVLAAAGERDVEDLRGDFRVVEEQLEEIAHAIKQQAAFGLRLEREVLRHHRSRAARHHRGA